jgi:ABC-2 type transport system permease protein
MTMKRLIRSELRKLTTTKMPLAFLGVLFIIAALNAFAVITGTDMDGSKGFIATEADQQSLMAFAFNAFMGAGLFGAIAVAREYGHNTVVPTFLAAPVRSRAVLSQLIAVAIGGCLLSLLGAALIVAAVAIALPTTDYGFLLPLSSVVRVLAAAAFAGIAGAVLGAGIGATVRNVGGAVTLTVFTFMVAPPLVVQLANGTGPWMPANLANVISGTVGDVGLPAALVAMVVWALVPALIGFISVQRRDVV